MLKVFICSPLRGDIEGNQAKAREYARTAILEGHLPIVPHIYFTQFLDENNAKERALGIEAGMELAKDCDEMWIYGIPTEGMKQEIAAFKGTKIWK